MLSKLKTALVLFVIGALSGLIIFSVNNLTEDVIAENQQTTEEGYYREIFHLAEDVAISFEKNDLTGGLDQEVVLYDSSDAVIGYIYKALDNNNYGNVTVLVGITVDGLISSVVISDFSNTPTFVNRIKTNYLAGLSEQAADDLTFDSKTGATYTYTSVVKVVENASAYYLESRGE